MNLFGEEQVKILPLWQPWASLVVWGEKRYETRHWQTPYRGIVAIHAAKRFNRDQWELVLYKKFFNHACHRNGVDVLSKLPLGRIIGSVELINIVPTESVEHRLSSKERTFGDYTTGRFAWMLRNPVVLKEPIFYKGQQGMWDAPEEVKAVILESRKAVATSGIVET